MKKLFDAWIDKVKINRNVRWFNLLYMAYKAGFEDGWNCGFTGENTHDQEMK